ncbi:hypothetical protein BAUCODRAFT_380484 [Baudoinia panamericana UAMH 10762]|uniref:Uncharacterized protein n=1 Tax=Baudoinia panamericana (strain UAMH 10762) TaxID=717646 RepID=M2NI72_BAUPA|nr:uncharacterized protein BAUCODRAFT_380484 [Baudoinia panamericana UAMH 10762]EMC98790.1 hypothetical protein BAUCODRAFT_380484 [Baudoinia panamericana UAMH 10762]
MKENDRRAGTEELLLPQGGSETVDHAAGSAQLGPSARRQARVFLGGNKLGSIANCISANHDRRVHALIGAMITNTGDVVH